MFFPEAATRFLHSPGGIGVLIFVLIYILIASEKVEKAIAAVLGAGIMAACGVAEVPAMLNKIDLNVLALLIGMMIIVNIMASSGVFEWIAVMIARQSKGNGILIVIEFMLATAFVSAFMDNVTTVILMAPVTILICQFLRLPVTPILILEAVFSNIGGTATLVGDPPNILIGSSCKLSFNEFIVNLGPVVALIAVVLLAMVVLLMHKQLKTSPEMVKQVLLTEPSRAILDSRRLKRSLAIFGLTLLGFFTTRLTKIDPGVVAMCGAFLMSLVCGAELGKMLEKVEWPTIMFFCGLFMMVGALEINGVFEELGQAVLHLTRGNFGMTLMIILWSSALLSAIIDNIPLVIAMIPLIQSIIPAFASSMGFTEAADIRLHIAEPLFWSLALGACLGGNGTLIGASANVVISQVARKNGYHLSFREFTAYGFPLMVMSLLISSGYLYFRYIYQG